MNLELYTSALSQLRFGKRLPGAVYVFRDDAFPFHEPIESLIGVLKSRHGITSNFNVLKFRTDELKISFLSYPEFLDDPHPALREAISIDLVTGKSRRTDYSDNINPPILHRKEAFIPKEHPQWNAFRRLTEAEESAGLYEQPSTIGFRLNWERLLQQKGLALIGHSLEKVEGAPEVKHAASPFVQRHRTAMTRYDLSKPVKTLLEYGLLETGNTFFDYGCGQGADMRGLCGLG